MSFMMSIRMIHRQGKRPGVARENSRRLMTTHSFARCLAVFVALFVSTTSGGWGCCGAETPEQFLTEFCIKCHNDETHRGDVRLHRLNSAVVKSNAESWKDVVHKIQRGEMPPEDEKQPTAKQRRAFLESAMASLDRFESDSSVGHDSLMRLTNQQIANSLRDLLHVSRDISGHLIEDPVDKHGYSVQSELDISGGYFDLYLPQLHKAVGDAVPDLEDDVREAYRLAGNDWEKQHYLTSWGMSERSRRNLYKGPKWLGDKFEIPLPPKHEYRMYVKDNRPEGEFRIRLTVRNEPPATGGAATSQELSVFLDEGFMRPYKLVENITVPVQVGSQQFELCGNVRDWVGVSLESVETTPPKNKRDERKRLASWRILSVQNNNKLVGFPLPRAFGEPDRSGEVYLVRPDDQWISAFGPQRGLLPSYLGPAAAHPGNKGKTKPIYADVMKSHGHVVIERIEFDLPFRSSWPPPVLKQFVTGDRIDRDALPSKLREFAAIAWRQPLDEELSAYVDRVLAIELEAAGSELVAIRNALVVILSDPRFLYLRRSGGAPRRQNLALVSRLAFFLWNGPPDATLLSLANQDDALSDALLVEQVERLLADPRSDRFLESFVSLWVGFSAFDQIAIDPNYYPKWRPSTKPHMKAECVALFKELLRHDLSCLNLLDSDFVMINQRMGEHYQIESNVGGLKFVRAPSPKGRGGVLTQAAVLLAYSNGQDSHAVNRGVWVRSRLLGNPPSDPPPDVPALADQDAVEVDALSIKQRLENHRIGTCYDCHKDIDPWGIAMEGFDAIGLPRNEILKITTQKRGRKRLPVVKNVEIDGRSVDGMVELKRYLREHRNDDFAFGFSRHLLSYAIGRRLSYRDEQQVAQLKLAFEKRDYRMTDLIKAIATSPLFKGGVHSQTATEPSQDEREPTR